MHMKWKLNRMWANSIESKNGLDWLFDLELVCYWQDKIKHK